MLVTGRELELAGCDSLFGYTDPNRQIAIVSTRRLEQCRSCRYQCSVTARTVFHRTKIPLRTWFWAIFFVARHKQGISALQLQKDLGIGSYQTAWLMLHKLRSGLKPRDRPGLRGIVEADDSYVEILFLNHL